jgi:PAS domain S-box-containing protein
MKNLNTIDGESSRDPMKDKERFVDEAQKLGFQTEQLLEKQQTQPLGDSTAISSEQIQAAFHELRVRHVELEVQSDHLRWEAEETESARTSSFDRYGLAALGCSILGENDLVIEANSTAAALLGVAREGLIKKPISQLIFKEDQEIYSRHRRQLLETGMPQAFDLRIVKKDKAVFRVRLNAAVSRDAIDAPLLLLVLSGITEYQQEAGGAWGSENRFRKFFEQHSAAMLTIDTETGRILDANEAAVHFYGWSLEELKRMRIQEINTLPPEAVKAEMTKAASLKKVRFEFRHSRADGSICDVEVFSNTIEIAGKRILFSIIHDITERKRAEEVLREEEAYLRAILRTTVDGFWEVDMEGNILQVNDAYCRMSGYTEEELLKLDISAIDTTHNLVDISERRLRIIANGAEIFETQHRRKDSSIFHVEMSVTYIQTGGGKFVSFCRDISERKLAEETLLRQTAELEAIKMRLEDEKRLLAAVMEALPTGVAITDKMGGCIESNAAFKKIWGGDPLPETQSVEDYTSYKGWWDSTGKPLAPEEWASAIAVQKGESTVGQILRIERFDGLEAYIINSAAPVHDAEGEIVGSAVAVQDITELWQMEKELLQNRKDFACAQEVGNVGSWRLDVRRNVLQWSDENHRIFGIPIGTPLTYETFLSTIHPDDRLMVDAEWKAGLRGKPYDVEHRLVVNGQIKWVREKAYLEIDRNGNLAGGFGITQDITERKQAELALQKNREELQIILDSSPILIFYKDLENRFVRVNKTLADLAGLPRKAIEGKEVSEIFPVQVKDYWKDDKEVIASGMPKVGIAEPIGLAAGTRWLQTDKIPYRDKDGRVIGIIGFSVDITERKQAEEALQAINNELERRVERRTLELQETQSHYLHAEKLAAIGKLSASIAHEFNNPLQGIMSVLKGLKKRAIMDEEDRDLLDAAVGESNRIKNLIRSLQDFNRPSSDKKVMMEVQRSIDSLLLLCKNDFKRRRISVIFNRSEGLPQILAVPDQIKQVFLNLLNNAADACMERSGMITISTWVEENSVAVAIMDTGVGIESEKLNLIFQPFYTTKPEVKGTGLGLSVCHGIVQNHRGEMRVESQPGKGSIFTVLLPISGE